MPASTCLKEGSGIPLVFLHGFLGTCSDWKAVCDFLPPSHCIGIHLPGHGGVPFSETFEIDIDRFHLIGYSMGGRLAMAYAAKNPYRIASLTIASAHPGLTDEAEKQKRLESDARWAKILLELPIDEFLKRWYDQPLFQFYKPDLSMRKKQNVQDLAKALMHYSLGRQPRFDLDNVLVGEWDAKFRALYINPILIPSSGHVVHLENPKAVAAAIEKRVFS